MTRRNRAPLAGATAVGLAALLGLAGHAHAAPGHAGAAPDPLAAKGDSTFARAQPQNGQARVIVTLDGALTPERRARIAALGGVVTQDLGFIHAAALHLPSRRLPALAALPFVRHVSRDGAVKKSDAFTVGSSGSGAAFQQYGLTGYGVTVAVVDSGVHMQAQDLQWPAGITPPKPTPRPQGSPPPGPHAGRIIDSVNYVPDSKGNVNAGAVDDLCGHGTHVTGIIAGDGAASTGSQYTQTFYGVAPLTSMAAVRVLDANGQGSVSTVLSGIQWVIANKAVDNIRVMNLSLGHPICDTYANDPLCQAVEAAWKAGIVVVCAAGNSGRLNSANTAGLDNEGWGTAYGSIQSPANDPYVITVGAMKQTDTARADDKIATYSSRGPSVLDLVLKPDLVAPGNRVISLDVNGSTLDLAAGGTNQIPLSTYVAQGNNLAQSSDLYFRLSGTSMASPVVAGAAALLLQKDPSLTPDTVKARLMAAADKMTLADGTADPFTYGAGYLDVPAAMQSTVTVPAGAYALSPLLYLDASGNLAVAMDPAVYGSRAIWGKSGIWNTGSLTDLRAVWGRSAIGSSAADTAASRAVWGSTGVAEQRAVWGRGALWSSSVGADRAIWGKSGAVDLSSVALHGEN